MIEETEKVFGIGGDLANLGSTPDAGKSPLSYEPPKKKEPLLPRIISIALHPLLMGVYSIALLFLYTDFRILFGSQFLRFITPVFFLTCVVPASSIYFLKRAGMIKDFELTNRNERIVPFVAVFCAYSLLLYYFASAGLFTWFLGILAAPLILIVIAAIVTSRWKISTHMMGIGYLLGNTLSVCYFTKGLNPYILFIILFILAGSLATSQLMLRRHTPAQVYAGFLAGLVVSCLCVLVGTYWAFIVLFFKTV